jgi:hypothetical protein
LRARISTALPDANASWFTVEFDACEMFIKSQIFIWTGFKMHFCSGLLVYHLFLRFFNQRSFIIGMFTTSVSKYRHSVMMHGDRCSRIVLSRKMKRRDYEEAINPGAKKYYERKKIGDTGV